MKIVRLAIQNFRVPARARFAKPVDEGVPRAVRAIASAPGLIDSAHRGRAIDLVGPVVTDLSELADWNVGYRGWEPQRSEC
jgi:hypothetical protein